MTQCAQRRFYEIPRCYPAPRHHHTQNRLILNIAYNFSKSGRRSWGTTHIQFLQLRLEVGILLQPMMAGPYQANQDACKAHGPSKRQGWGNGYQLLSAVQRQTLEQLESRAD